MSRRRKSARENFTHKRLENFCRMPGAPLGDRDTRISSDEEEEDGHVLYHYIKSDGKEEGRLLQCNRRVGMFQFLYTMFMASTFGALLLRAWRTPWLNLFIRTHLVLYSAMFIPVLVMTLVVSAPVTLPISVLVGYGILLLVTGILAVYTILAIIFGLIDWYNAMVARFFATVASIIATFTYIRDTIYFIATYPFIAAKNWFCNTVNYLVEMVFTIKKKFDDFRQFVVETALIPYNLYKGIINYLMEMAFTIKKKFDDFRQIVVGTALIPYKLCKGIIGTAFIPYILCKGILTNYDEFIATKKREFNLRVSNVQSLLQKPFQIANNVKARYDAIKESFDTLRSTVLNLSLNNLIRFSWSMFVWAARTSISTAQNRVIPAAVERVNRVRQQVQEPVENLRQTFKKLYRFSDSLFGDVKMQVLRSHNTAEIVIQSNSRLPQFAVVRMIQDAMRRNGKFQYIQDWVNSIEIPVLLVDNIRRSASMYTLRDRSMHFRRVAEDTLSARSDPTFRRRRR